MARRSRAREVALQLLFLKDQNGVPVPRPAVERFAHDRLRDPDLVAFGLALYDGVLKHQTEIDQALAGTAENWRLHRMMPADRNEAIELARRFGTAVSPGFVNGILDKIARTRRAEFAMRNSDNPIPPATPPATPPA